ncbi:hypothetical protein BCR34DRAFT_144293 [Clohesyomyces aquaticus]|uniref:Uncharacterized protein n=1 Tax=Clohesyomyces aquaticus TaxID=1231657 RepID=A0A1Y2A1V1_9PLEO|nr:hypothetical protein BCR34DRAFT_144293 [Clohesyomyces aquaticus]
MLHRSRQFKHQKPTADPASRHLIPLTHHPHASKPEVPSYSPPPKPLSASTAYLGTSSCPMFNILASPLRTVSHVANILASPPSHTLTPLQELSWHDRRRRKTAVAAQSGPLSGLTKHNVTFVQMDRCPGLGERQAGVSVPSGAGLARRLWLLSRS